MKRILSAILAAILCITLCACSGVKQEVYDAAKAGYEEATAKYDALKTKVEKYSAVIDALEKEDYDGAVAAVEAMRPAPEVTAVEITIDNLWDYFEITENRVEKRDADGNLYQVSQAYRLSLKEEYAFAKRTEYPTALVVGYEYDSSIDLYERPCVFDFDTLTCDSPVTSQINEHKSGQARLEEADYIFLYTLLVSCPTDPESERMAQIDHSENLEIVNASGTVYLVSR